MRCVCAKRVWEKMGRMEKLVWSIKKHIYIYIYICIYIYIYIYAYISDNAWNLTVLVR